MKLSEFDFTLPDELIAQDPVDPRDSCRLMHLNRLDHSINNRIFRDLQDLLIPGDVLVLNTSKVIPARILLTHDGHELEIFLLNKVDNGLYSCMVRPGKSFENGIHLDLGSGDLAIVQASNPDGTRLVSFVSSTGQSLSDPLIFAHGVTPLPPYIKHSHSSLNDYQTVYAKESGSVAAPTAGLHFTKDLLDLLLSKGIEFAEVNLHVNRGTFLPVRTENVEDHRMHSEFFSMSEDVALHLNKAKSQGRRIVAVGTTSVRVLESTFDGDSFVPRTGETDIYIFPGYDWKVVDALITNFHLPKSSLLLLVSSFAGKDFVFDAYQRAIEEKYRFYSFGDAMFIE